MGRFDRSFVIRMIRDFMIALTAIVVAELGGRYLLARYEFATEDRDATELAAERLADDVRAIMLNRGGPVAARTVYPILRRNHQKLGFEIGIVPSRLTTESIRRSFGFDPQGIPPAWPEGDHHEAAVPLTAEEFCTSCHVTARPGDVLGTVRVRSYRSFRMAEWWREARVISVMGLATVLLHTIVLFLLLRARMAPLLRLRETVGRLARGDLDLRRRADVRSEDEFGQLAEDLNHFLDRVCLLIEDVEGVLRRVAAVNQRLGGVSQEMRVRMAGVQETVGTALREAVELRADIAGPWEEAVDSLDLALRTVAERAMGDGMPRETRERVAEVLARFRGAVAQRQRAGGRLDELSDLLAGLSREVADDTHYMGEILLLEERMRVVAETGGGLLTRLRRTADENGKGTPDSERQ